MRIRFFVVRDHWEFGLLSLLLSADEEILFYSYLSVEVGAGLFFSAFLFVVRALNLGRN